MAELPEYLARCGRCLEHFASEPFLVEAFASVGIEHGKSTGEMAEVYFGEFHGSGHVRRGGTAMGEWEDARLVEVYEREDGKYEWRRLVLGNHEKVATSGSQGYETRAGAAEAAERENPGIRIVHLFPEEP